MSNTPNNLTEYNRFIGYLILTFTSVFIYFPLIWLANIFGPGRGLYTIWGVVSAFVSLFNFAFYHVRIPKKPMSNLITAAAFNIIILLVEYLLLFNSTS